MNLPSNFERCENEHFRHHDPHTQICIRCEEEEADNDIEGEPVCDSCMTEEEE